MDARVPRIAPFAVFMAFIGLEEIIRCLDARDMISIQPSALYALYPLKISLTGALLLTFRKHYNEIKVKHLLNLRHLAFSLLIGMLIFILWIRMDLLLNPLQVAQGFNPYVFEGRQLQIAMITVRLLGAVFVVPVMEELFWRSFLLRYIINPEFTKVTTGLVTWPSLMACSLLFGLEHHLFLAGVMAGLGYTLVLFATRSITHCILAHGLTNLLLGIYVLTNRQWSFW